MHEPRRLIHRLARRLGLWGRRGRLAVVHSPQYDQPIAGSSFDPQRADKILAFLTDERLIRRGDVVRPLPASLENILRVHTAPYIESLERPEVLGEILGMPVASEEVEGLLDLLRLYVGGTIQTTRLAERSGAIAVHLGGGFHHATPDRGMGFCVFNDIAVAIKRLQARGFDEPVLVVDLDLHDGNGTRAAFADDPSVHTFTIHNADWAADTAAAATVVEMGSGVTDGPYLEKLRRALPSVVDAHQPGLAVYVAGTDVAEDDALGDWRITSAGILERDQFVVSVLRNDRRMVPLAVVLGGGYGGSSWRHTARFLAWLTTGSTIEPPNDIEMLLRRSRAVMRSRESSRRGAADWELTEEDILGPALTGEPRFLGELTHHGVELQLERVEILPQLRRRGYRRPAVTLESGPTGETVRIYGDTNRQETLVELRAARSRSAIPGVEVLVVEWLLLQDPRAEFAPGRPKMPGQGHPGLGMLREVIVWLVVLAERLGLDGVVFTPAKYHVAAVAHRRFRFIDPARQGRFEALFSALSDLGLAAATRAIEEGRVTDSATGVPVAWETGPMALGVSAAFKERAVGKTYEAARAEARARADFRVDVDQPRAG
jgi:acetoin utilization deacetylase AcuC-like enzyme